MGSGKQLNDYIRSVRFKPFGWGTHDCLTFSNDAFRAFHGFGYADDWIGEYIVGGEPMLPSRMRQKFKADSFDEAIQQRLCPIGFVPPRGALVATKKVERWMIGYALGICLGRKAAFLSRNGIVCFPIEEIERAWVPK